MNTHYLVTNREVTTNPRNTKHFRKVNNEEFIRTDGREMSSESLRFGKYMFNDEDDEGNITIYKEPDLEEFKIDDPDEVPPSDEPFDELYKAMGKSERYQGEVLVFIHGFKSDLERSLYTLKKLHKAYVEKDESPIKHIVMFTWPAMGKIFKYRNDARDARTSGYALGRAIHKMADFLGRKTNEDCKQRIHLMAHSMGGQVLEAMLQQLSDAEEEQLNSLFHEVILVGADLDYDALEKPRPLYDLIDICERIHVFYHKKDMALVVSENTKNAMNRLGKCGAKNSRNLADDVYQYDITHTKDDVTHNIIHDNVNHWSYYTSNETIEMIIDVLTDYQEDF